MVTIMPNDLVDRTLLALAGDGGKRKTKPEDAFDGMRLKKCHWQDVSELYHRRHFFVFFD